MLAKADKSERSTPMVADTHLIKPNIRRLRVYDQPELVDHFQRLNPQTRRLRFGCAVSDRYVTDYAAHILTNDALTFGAFAENHLRGVAEMRGLSESWPRTAEVALLVEPAWQDKGIGEALFNRLISAAQNRGIKKLCMLCLRENRRMQHLARKHHAHLEIQSGDVEATLQPSWPTLNSIFQEVMGETQSYLQATFHLHR